MTVSPTYPGVYLTETTNVPHVVTPATTNLTAFVGAFAQGPVSTAVLVNSWPQFQSIFGGIAANSLASYGVWQFFLNGGIGAWIVRVTPAAATATDDDAEPNPDDDAAKPEPAAAATAVNVGGLDFTASSPGKWGSSLSVGLTVQSQSVGRTTVSTAALAVTGPGGRVLERLTNLPNDSLSGLAAAINDRAQYVRAAPNAKATDPPTAMANSPLSEGSDGTWTDAAFVSAVETVLAAGSPLDAIAPQVFNLMCIPDAALSENSATLYDVAEAFCAQRQAFLIVDPPAPTAATAGVPALWDDLAPVKGDTGAAVLTSYANLLEPDNGAGAVYYPWLQIPDPANQQRPRLVPPSGTVAGVYAATDTARGVWKAPAGTMANLRGVTGLADVTVDDTANGTLNVAGVNALRTFPIYGSIVWGARTLAGSDLADSPWKYVPVRRLADFIEQSLQQSLRWAVFEPNSPPLWSSITLEVAAFMSGLYAAGAFSGATAAQAYTVVCDASTTSPTDMLEGIVNVNVGFQPVYPAEFVMLNVQIQAAPATG